ncbi:MAG TPA: pseudouridine-5'-phosphate glycosidase [Acidimicrobiales bacterium]|nr:pseudouridine-5'-phosphate glycosidase [Acidimicrobiales bacterium]
MTSAPARAWAGGDGSVAVLSEEVLEASQRREPIVALESTIISHGLPRPRNLEVAHELESIVQKNGACPATIAVLDGVPHIGLGPAELQRISSEEGTRKLGLRDLAVAMATRSTGATTVSATAFLAAACGIRVFATGGVGGVHRGWLQSWDESADLLALSRTHVTIVAAGVKSILDIPATVERLETLNVTVIGYGTAEFPGFYLHSSGHRLDWRVDSPATVAEVMRCQDALGDQGALFVANPVPPELQLDPALHDRVLAEALDSAEHAGIGGQALTPYLLDRMVRGTDGAALEANLAAVRGNCALAATIAAEWRRVGGER